MKTIRGVQFIESVDDILDDTKLSNQFYTWQGEKSSDFVNEPERAARCHDAAADGCDGSFHWEVIEDFREFGHDLLRESERSLGVVLDRGRVEDVSTDEIQVNECLTAFDADIESLVKFHQEAGSYEKQCS